MGGAPPILTPAEAVALPTWRAAYSDRTAALMATLAQIAYLEADDPLLKARVEGGGFDLVRVVATEGLMAYLAVGRQFAVLAFQGTEDIQGWMDDLHTMKTSLPGHPGVEVHMGFWWAFGQLEADLRQALLDHVPSSLGLYITGHSLGGALAQLASARFERDNLAACYTFGSPRVATAGFDLAVKCPHYRVINAWDVVPSVPPASWGFRHSGDPRLLAGPAPVEALRRDRSIPARLLVDAWEFLELPITHRLTAVDDHNIDHYRAKLEGISLARNGGVTH